MIRDLWYKNAIIYSLDLDSFMDGNGDGIGDFDGLMRRLDYLEFLHVDAVWLAPFQPSPMRDNGYDIADYYGVDRRYGSSGDFVEFMHEAEKRGIKVLIDLVVNHTSDQHPWFQEARSDPDSPYRNWYLWSKKRPSNWNKGMVFPGVQKSVWTKDEKAGEYYYHRFYEFQPDLNMDNPEVREEVARIIGFWVQLGVHGFRVDAVPFIIESVEPGEENPELKFEYLAEFRRILQWRKGDAVLLGEANVMPEDTLPFFGNDGDTGIHMMFNFFVNQYLFYALATTEVEPLREAIRATADIPAISQWAQFLRNHDELDLGRLTDEERERVFERFAPEEGMRLYNRGIRRRLAPMLGDREHEELAYSVMFSLPGSPVIRFGDELRMGDDQELPEREAVRTPMQWADEPNGGFSQADADRLPTPVIDEGVWSYQHINVEGQRRDPESFLNWMAAMIRLRKECPEIGWGTCEILDVGDERVLALLYEWRGNAVLILNNFGEGPHEVKIRLDRPDADRLSDLRKEEAVLPGDDGVFRVPLDALDYRWYRVGGLNYAANRSRQ